jgi:predicted Na+-dependent transporter
MAPSELAGAGDNYSIINQIKAIYKKEGKAPPTALASTVYYNRGVFQAAAVRNALKLSHCNKPTPTQEPLVPRLPQARRRSRSKDRAADGDEGQLAIAAGLRTVKRRLRAPLSFETRRINGRVVLEGPAAALALMTIGSRTASMSRADEVSIVFCGSQKSLVTGAPMANVLFSGAAVGTILLPIMIYHMSQLFVCAWLARRHARSAVGAAPPIVSAGARGELARVATEG